MGKEILNECLNQLQVLPPVKKVKILNAVDRIQQDIDGQLEISTEGGKQIFYFMVKGELKRPILEHLVAQKKPRDKPLLLMARYVNPSIAADFRKQGIYFIDAQGNGYIHIKDIIYVEKEGKKPVIPEERRITSIFNPKGMQLIFTLMAEPHRLNQTVRELAKETGISKDRVSTGLRDLQKMSMILKTQGGWMKFADKKALLEQWLANYGDRMRSKLVIGNYKILPRYMNELPQRLKKLFSNHPESYALSGTLGADRLIPYYKGKTAEIFVKPALLNDLVNELKLMPAREHDVTVFNRFSDGVIFQQKKTPVSVAHPLLLYAEMLYQGGSRALETAGMIYNRYLKQDFDED